MEDTGKVKIKEEEIEQIIKCHVCDKVYHKQGDLQSHMKLKHPQPKEQKEQKQAPPRKPRSQPRNRVLEVQQNEHQDTIYAYMGQLGQKNQQNSSRQELLMSEQLQRQSIQTNYSFNKVIRTPYEKQINPVKYIPREWIQEHSERQFLRVLATEMEVLYDKINLEKERWEFRDPMGPEQQADDQFSLMQIRKLIYNYPKRSLTMKYPHFSIYMLWVGRICKPPAWIQFFMIISTFLLEYYNSEQTGKKSEKWQKFFKSFESKPIKSQLMEKLTICDDKTVKKFTEFFMKWVQLFQLVEFC